MKSNSSLITFVLAAISSLLINCGDNKAANSEKQLTNSSSIEKKVEPGKVAAPAGEGIVGNWELRLEVFDDNGNRIPDEAELKRGSSNFYRFQFNADGSCRIQGSLTGRYERKTENGLDKLYVYRKRIEGVEDKDPLPDEYLVTSLKKDELVLQLKSEIFWFFKRL